ncbi:hypothetical protein GCM10010129_40110 [Streptomyces fumigatiscleroticus]|nr:hypothetical protein GCM10010129_40110 [Streptomyces fumigatiscleroticus]
MSRPAVGELVDAGLAGGTAFAVDRRTLITCWHSLTDPGGKPADGPFTVRLGTDTLLSAAYVDHDARLDVALLSLDPAHELPDGWHPLELGSSADAAKGTRVEALGWAVRNPSTVEPQTMPAEIVVPHTSIHDGEPVVQLFSFQVAAGLRPRGFSGGPVLAGTLAGPVVVGVVRWMQPEDADPTRATGGTVYACLVQDIVSRWPRLAPARPPLEVLAGDPGSPHRTLVADFLDTHLNGPGGRLPFAGRRDELAALDAWLADSDASPYHLVTGGAGTGKSTLLTRWAESLAQRAHPAADPAAPATHIVFFPVSLRYDSAGVGPVVKALLHGVARVHDHPYDPTAGVETLRDTLSQLLTRPAPAGNTLLVLVDALDEADGWRRPNALYLPRGPGERVRIVLTARRTRQLPTAHDWLRALELDTDNASTVLTALDEDAVSELLRQALPGRAGRPPTPRRPPRPTCGGSPAAIR